MLCVYIGKKESMITGAQMYLVFFPQVVFASKDPVWEEGFTFFVHSVKVQQLIVQVCKTGRPACWLNMQVYYYDHTCTICNKGGIMKSCSVLMVPPEPLHVKKHIAVFLWFRSKSTRRRLSLEFSTCLWVASWTPPTWQWTSASLWSALEPTARSNWRPLSGWVQRKWHYT